MARRLAALVAALSVAMAQDPGKETRSPDRNPEYACWASFNVGSTATYRQVTETDGLRTEEEVTHKLVKVTPDLVLIETVRTELSGKERKELSPERREISAKAEAPRDKEGVTKEGKEVLEIAGQKLTCTWSKVTLAGEGSKEVKKRWMAPEVPGHLVKKEHKHEGPKATTVSMMLLDYKAR